MGLDWILVNCEYKTLLSYGSICYLKVQMVSMKWVSRQKLQVKIENITHEKLRLYKERFYCWGTDLFMKKGNKDTVYINHADSYKCERGFPV